MSGNREGYVKISFEIRGNESEVELERVWAVPVGNGYRVDNVPFYAREIALGDVVEATMAPDGVLCFSQLIAASGHTTVRLWFKRQTDVQAVRDTLREKGCPSELDLSRLVAVDVPPEIPYSDVRVYLDAQEAAGVFEYEEGCLGQER